MSYVRAIDVLPEELIYKIQKFIDGEYIYIPRKENHRKTWGDRTKIKQEIAARNGEIYRRYLAGESTTDLSREYFLSPKSIQKIIVRMKLEST